MRWLKMKHNYTLYIILFFVILLRGLIVNFINNIGTILFVKNPNLEVNILNDKINYLEEEYNLLVDFKNNLNLNYDYIITNTYMNNYSYDKLLINGNNYNINDEVVNENGLIGIISKTYDNISEVSYIYDTNLTVKIGDFEGKIIGKDEDNNLIITELSNYNNLNLNDKVYSVNNTYIGRIIKINKEDVDTRVIAQTINLDNINYVAVVSRQS
jgi:cell shape-determining protein MreC